MKLSKSRFVAGCQCLKRLYWQIHEPELAAQPDAAAECSMRIRVIAVLTIEKLSQPSVQSGVI
jgi:hypothetical protein